MNGANLSGSNLIWGIHACIFKQDRRMEKTYQDNKLLFVGETLDMVTCPRCGAEVFASSKEWNYGAFHVKRFSCKRCGKGFMAYYREGRLSHTIPKGTRYVFESEVLYWIHYAPPLSEYSCLMTDVLYH